MKTPTALVDACSCRLEELAAPYYVLKDKGYDVVIASTKGGRIPLDPASLQEQNMTDHTKKFLEDGKPSSLLSLPVHRILVCT